VILGRERNANRSRGREGGTKLIEKVKALVCLKEFSPLGGKKGDRGEVGQDGHQRNKRKSLE